MKSLRALPLLSFLTAGLCAAPESLFDGRSLSNWEGDTTNVWRVENGAIVGGSMEGNPRNEFLATKKRYKNFVLRLEYKLVGTEGFVNGGVQFRSSRLAEPAHEMIGYQADIGAGYTGCIYDESRRKVVVATAIKQLMERIEKPGDWNRMEITAKGTLLQVSINGTLASMFTEPDPQIPQEGLIALQIHGNCKAVISYRNITIEELPD